MKKILLLLCAFSLSATLSFAQTKKKDTPPPPPPQQQQKKPPPYVYKKDFDEKMASVDSRINSALGTANAVKNEVSGKLDKVDELDAKMAQVEEILNVANIKLGKTSDSLKDTRLSAQEFRSKTEARLAEMEKEGKSTKNMLYGIIGLIVIVAGALLFVMTRRMRKLKNALHIQNEDLRVKIRDGMENTQRELKDELNNTRQNLQTDMRLFKKEVGAQLETTNAQLKEILERLG